MKVICKENTAKNLDPKEISESMRKEHEFSYVTVGTEYIVMGLAGYRDRSGLYYLVNDHAPFWVPYGLFEIIDNAFPPNWHMKIIDRKKYPDTNVLWLAGFYELCADEKYYDALIERKPEALQIYSKRRAEFKQWYEEREEARKFYPKEAKKYYSIND